MSSPLIIFGSGGHAKVVIATARACGLEVTAAYDDNPERVGSAVLGVPIRGTIADGRNTGSPALIAIGSNRAREQIAATHVGPWVSLVHPRSTVHDSVTIGEGTVVFAGSIVQPDTRLGSHAILNTGCTVDHDCELGDFVHIGPGTNLCGGVTIGSGTLIGVGSAIIPRVSVGDWGVIGAGAAVTSDVAAGARVLGVPARHR